MKSLHERTFLHCPSCGGRLRRERDRFLRWRCSRCGEIRYLNPKVGVAMIVEHGGGIILSRRALAPYKGYWTIPSGYVEYEETCEEAALRESREELGLAVRILSLQDVYSFRDDPRAHMVLVVYICRTVGGTLRPGGDVSEVRVVTKRRLPRNIAFSGIRQAIRDYWKFR
jgi:ADP-ribose pyrophosphatase YjhB (NUDIX family)